MGTRGTHLQRFQSRCGSRLFDGGKADRCRNIAITLVDRKRVREGRIRILSKISQYLLIPATDLCILLSITEGRA